jgi:hypothetical protein
MGWRIHQMDVKTSFLNGVIKEEVYIEQSHGFEVHGRESHVCRVKKDLYEFKQAPNAWYSRIDGYLQSMDFTKSEADPKLYLIQVGEDPLILVLYVDDLFLTGAEKLIAKCKRDLASEFEIADILTKSIIKGKFGYFRDKLGVAENTSLGVLMFL